MHGDWETYSNLCDPTLTCFESEANGCLVEGLDFHQFYFDLERPSGGKLAHVQTTLASPHVRMLGGEAAVGSYVRLTLYVSAEGSPGTRSAEETRVWPTQHDQWRWVPVHRRPSP